MQNIKSKPSKYRYTLYMAPTPFILLLLSIPTLLPLTISRDTSALSSQSNTNIQFTLNPTISLNVSGDLNIDDLLPGNSADSNIITVSVDTNTISGYTLTTTVDKKAGTSGAGNPDTYLTNTGNSNYKFTSISSTTPNLSDFQDNTWGYSYSVDNGTTWISGSKNNTSVGYNGLPQDNNTNPQEKGKAGITLLDTNSNTGTEVKFKIGAKASTSQPAGEYTNTINFYAVSKPTPISFYDAFAAAGKEQYNGYYTMQDMNTDICSAVELYGDDGIIELIDIRDNETYKIAKLKDDNCWMLENLRLGDDGLVQLSTTDTNIADDYTLLASSSECFSIETACGYTNAELNALYKYGTATNYGMGNGKVGVYYNYCAASAGTYCYAYGEGVDIAGTPMDSPYDVCSFGWRMPTSDEYTILYTHYNTTSDAADADSLYHGLSLSLSGKFDNNAQGYLGTYARLWSSTYNSVYAMESIVAWTTVIQTSASTNRYLGLPVRCLAK